MTKKLAMLNRLRPRIISQGVVDLEQLAERVTRNTTFNSDEFYGMLRLAMKESVKALQAGETVKLDGLVNIRPYLKVGGRVGVVLQGDRRLLAELNNPQLWTASKVSKHEFLRKGIAELVEIWNAAHPDDPVED